MGKGGVDGLPFWSLITLSETTISDHQFSESEWWGFLPP